MTVTVSVIPADLSDVDEVLAQAGKLLDFGQLVGLLLRGATWLPAPKDEIGIMFNGRELVEPGLVLVSRWRPDAEPSPDADAAWTYCGVAAV